MISVLTTVFEDLLRGEQVDGLTAVYEYLLIVGQADVQQAVHGCLHVQYMLMIVVKMYSGLLSGEQTDDSNAEDRSLSAKGK